MFAGGNLRRARQKTLTAQPTDTSSHAVPAVRWRFLAATLAVRPAFSRRRRAASDDHAGQSEQAVKLLPVLGQPPIPHFPMPE